MRWVAALAIVVLVAGCGDQVPNSGSAEPSQTQASAAEKPASGGFLAGLLGGGNRDSVALSRVTIAGLVVAAPEGYCVDPSTVDNRVERGFALIASCRILTGGSAGQLVEPVLVSVTIGPRGAEGGLPSAQDLATTAGSELLQGEEGRGYVAAQLATGGDALFEGGDERYWRGAFMLQGRMIGLALYAPEGSALAGARGANKLGRVRAALRAANSPQPAGGASALAEKPTQSRVLGRLFNR